MNKTLLAVLAALLAGCIQQSPSEVDTAPTPEPIPTIQPAEEPSESDDLQPGDEVTVYFFEDRPIRMMYGIR